MKIHLFAPFLMIYLGIMFMSMATLSYFETERLSDLLFYYFQYLYLFAGLRFFSINFKYILFNEKLHELQYKTIMEFGKVRGKHDK